MQEVFDTVGRARKAYPEWLKASEMRNMILEKYHFSIHETNIGIIAKNHHRLTVDFRKCDRDNDEVYQKLGHLYDPADLDFYAWFTHIIAAQRGVLPNSVKSALANLNKEYAYENSLGYHMHHIIPKHAGGTNDRSNLIRLTIYQHAMAHEKLYEEYGRPADG